MIEIEGVLLTSLSHIPAPGGDVYHAVKHTDPGFIGFGETYFSTITYGAIKAWKRHRRMTLNLIVPVGDIRFVLYDDRKTSSSYREHLKVDLSPNNYFRLTVPPMLWMGFQGLGQDLNLLLNVADIVHESDEMDRLGINAIEYDWEIAQ
ncbi:MAG: dTDP-4-dehydrorhamnose 3,5-epimerase [Gammaproteobacteria bacterium]|nr:dTDP-4-dehydrorhamnose 3,5-epimerase [Gammaproteobacteria bacterium]